FSRRLRHTHLAAVFQRLESDPRRLSCLRVLNGEVRQMNRRLARHDAARRRLRGLRVALHQVDALHESAFFLREDGEHSALLALVLASEDDHLVALLDFRSHQSTSGASETIFMWFFARSSRVTGPKMRVPIGSPWLLISTAALRSKRITLPST